MRPPALLLIAAATVLSAQAPDAFAPLRFLVGTWQGEDGKGTPGTASRGSFTLAEDLGGKVLVRRNFAEYPAQGGKPAFRHDDLMTVYAEGGQLKALYVDNEGHVIHYAVAKAGDGVVLQSDGPGPRFRNTFLPKGADQVLIRFEIAPPGKDFTPYIEATAKRVR
jgi:hypothetical protein